jgi:hypothetical protein
LDNIESFSIDLETFYSRPVGLDESDNRTTETSSSGNGMTMETFLGMLIRHTLVNPERVEEAQNHMYATTNYHANRPHTTGLRYSGRPRGLSLTNFE